MSEQENFVHETISRIKKNADQLTGEQAKNAIRDVAVALVTLIVDIEPRLIDPEIPTEDKTKYFFSAILKLSMEASGAHFAREGSEKKKRFNAKMDKFKDLEYILTLLAK